jgi:Pyridoxamine 5'-phosphate oxidase
MGKRYPELQPDQTAFIAQQHLFFVATAPAHGRVNLSPKGMDALRVLSPTRILWLNLTGSGNETAAHLAHDPRITLMWCGFETRPLILRTYGTARATHRDAPDWPALAALLPDLPGARQIMEVTIDLVQSSCGFAVPFMDFAGDRPVLRDWALDKGEDGLRDYWRNRNAETIDGAPTGIAPAP